MFGQAETAVEAWTLLASSLGQQTFVKSDFEKICFVEKSDDSVDTQVRGGDGTWGPRVRW